jgi:hypothetical protein
MPNVKVAAVHDGLLLGLIDSMRELPDPLVDEVVVTEHLVHPCIKVPTALIAASDDTADDDLRLVVEAVNRAGVTTPDDWRYQPSLETRTPWREVSFYGLDADETYDIAQEVLVGLPNYFVVLTKVMNLRMQPAPYAEMRVALSQDPLAKESALRVATTLSHFLDVELFWQDSLGVRQMNFIEKIKA